MNDLDISIKRLVAVNKSISKLTVEKEELTASIINSMNHEHEGQRSYEYGIYKIECKTPMVYSLDTARYKSGDVVLHDGFNPIKQSVTYSVDKIKCDEYMANAPADAKAAICELISKKPGKSAVTIKARS